MMLSAALLLSILSCMLFCKAEAAQSFLFSGQSNQEGQTTQGGSIEGNSSLFLDVYDMLTHIVLTDFEKRQALYERILQANLRETEGYPAEASLRITNETMNLYSMGLIGSNLIMDMENAQCSFTIPGDPSGGTSLTPVNWDSNCGESFGHELMFSHALTESFGFTETFSSIKVAKGGTEIHKDWYPDYGQYWPDLKAAITDAPVGTEWSLFVWHQGSQEVWSGDRHTELTYLGNLTDLVAAVREEMFAASSSTTFACKEAIPVVIVQLGYWPRADIYTNSQVVRQAQADFCDSDPRAKLVITNDLSQFYHYDAPSFLVMGYRIAEAYQTLLDLENASPFVCPSPVSMPSASPSSAPGPGPTCVNIPCKNSNECCFGTACTGQGRAKTCTVIDNNGVPSAAPSASPGGNRCGSTPKGGSCAADTDCATCKCRSNVCR